MSEVWQVYVTGTVSRKPYTSAKFAAFTIKSDPVPHAQKQPLVDVVVYDAGPISVAGMLSEGERVTVKGHFGVKKLQSGKGQEKQDVKVDGRDVWMPQVIADEIESDSAPAF